MILKIMKYMRNLTEERNLLLDRQWSDCRKMLRWAYEEVPYYRELFDESGIGPDDIETPEDMMKIPLSSKSDLRRANRQMIAKPYEGARLWKSVTSGSTGQSTTTYFNAQAWFLLKYFLKYRSKRFVGMRPGHRLMILADMPTENVERNNRLWTNRLIRKRMVSVYEPMEKNLEIFREWRPNVLYGMPSYFAELKKVVERDKISWLRPEMIFLSSELVDYETKRELERAFHCKVHDIYGSTEFKEIAWECKNGNYHVNADTYFVEIVENKNRVKTGEEGSVVVTSLINRAMPLIRYDLGDRGTLMEEQCGCGCTFPVMKAVTGRSVDYLILENGRLIAPLLLTNTIKKCAKKEINRFQVIQTSKNEITVKIVPDEGFGIDTEKLLETKIKQAVSPELSVRIEKVPSIPNEPNGKYKIVKSLLKDVIA